MGERAKFAWNHGALTAWVILIIVGAIVAGKFWQQSNEIDQRARENHALIIVTRNNAISIKQLQQEQTDSCRNYLVLRNAVNRFHGTMISLLRTAEKARVASYRRAGHHSDRVAARDYKRLLRSLHTVKRTCAQRRP